MIARKYNSRIEIWHSEAVPDNYGGNTVADYSIGSFWAEVKQNSSFKDNSVGKADIKNSYTFKIRQNPFAESRLDNLYIIFKGKKYVVNEYTYNDVLRRELNLIANG